MALEPLELLRRQAESAARKQIRQETADVRRELSLVRRAQQMSRRAGQALEQAAAARPAQPGAADGLEPAELPEQPPVCADGYVRRTPVQPYRTPVGYCRRQRRRLAMLLVTAALVVLLAAAVFRSGLLRF